MDIEDDVQTPNDEKNKILRPAQDVIWSNVVVYAAGHLAAVYGCYLSCTSAKWMTLIWSFLILIFGGFGITGGAHRLWSHRAYKAKWPLRLFVAVGQTMALQKDIYRWCWDHRMHHKYAETDADPFNALRGFFFSHIGWMLCGEHAEVTRHRPTIMMHDLQADPIVTFQQKFYFPLAILIGVVFPLIVPYYLWNESLSVCFFVPFLLRLMLSLNATWMVNSVAHKFQLGHRPYDRFLSSNDNCLVALLTIGEGFHNYHHVFPWDYKTAELGGSFNNWTTVLIDWFSGIGWAYDRKTVTESLIRKRVQRTGDGSHYFSSQQDILEN